ncbi:MAG: ABC transporter ATP-binding protein [Pirellulales bacterium]|nr:ABC transporter ATP-binding protein [Thermoguttaceae bacterium]MDD4788904.1 ABC transporter ATP-binding protein [Pirellulales bacterium]MDI9444621.1 ABC transporter ATP-binding protein [Planctomycetota bacterium]
MCPQPIIQFRRVSKVYHKGGADIHPLDEITLTIQEGDFVALMGPSGSGKTTLLNLLGGLDTPTSGEVIVCGQDLAALSSHERARWRCDHVAYVFQAYNLLPVLTAYQNVELPLTLMPLSRRQRREHALKALEIVGLADRVHHRPDELSGGQEQRVAIARALASDPDLLLADEPTGDLDAHSAQEIMSLLIALNRDYRKTIILVTHDPKVAHAAHRELHLEKGVLSRDVDVKNQRM